MKEFNLNFKRASDTFKLLVRAALCRQFRRKRRRPLFLVNFSTLLLVLVVLVTTIAKMA